MRYCSNCMAIFRPYSCISPALWIVNHCPPCWFSQLVALLWVAEWSLHSLPIFETSLCPQFPLWIVGARCCISHRDALICPSGCTSTGCVLLERPFAIYLPSFQLLNSCDVLPGGCVACLKAIEEKGVRAMALLYLLLKTSNPSGYRQLPSSKGKGESYLSSCQLFC